MSQQHQYNFKGKGPTNPSYRPLWLKYFHEGNFAKVRPSAWRVYCFLLFISDYYTFQCEISHEEIAQSCGLSRQSVPELTRELMQEKLISYHTPKVRQKLRYYLTVPESIEPGQEDVVYAGEVIANKEVDIHIMEKSSIPDNVSLKRELFLNGFFTSLGRDHSTWKAYCSLLYRADFGDGYCFPDYNQIAKDSGMSRRTVVKVVQNLEEYGLIRIKKWRSKNNKIVNGYYVWPLDKETYIVECKKPTTRSAKSRQRRMQNSDNGKCKKPTTQDVGNMHPNINPININTSSSIDTGKAGGGGEDLFKEQIKEFEKLFYDFTKVAIERSSLEKPIFRNWVKSRLETYGYETVKYVICNNDKLYTLKRLDTSLKNYHTYLQDRKESKGPELTGAEILLHNQLKINAYTEMLEDQPENQSIQGQINKLAKIIGKQQLTYPEKLPTAQQIEVCKKLEEYYTKQAQRGYKPEHKSIKTAISGHRIKLEGQLEQETNPVFQLEQKRRLFEGYEQKVQENPNGSILFRPAMNRLKKDIEELERQGY